MARIYVLSGADIGRTYDIEGSVDLGRGKEADVSLRAPSVSRRHARIERRGERWFLEDLGSSNGSTFAGRPLAKGTPVELESGTVFRLGELELRFRAEAEVEVEVEETAPAQAPAFETESPDEIELEGSWAATADIPVARAPVPAPPDAPRPSAPRPAPPRAARAAAAKAAEIASAAAGGERKTSSGGQVLQYRRIEARGGLFSADLGQQPLLVRWTLYLLALAVFLGLAWGAFKLTTTLRAQNADDFNGESE